MPYKRFALAFLCIAACQDKEAPKPTPASPERGAGSGGAPVEQQSMGIELHRFEEPSVEYPLQKEFALLEKGTGTPQVLRYAPTAGTVQYTTLTKLTTRKLSKGIWSPAETLPPIKGGLTLTAGSGVAALAVRIHAPEIVGSATPSAQAYVAAQKPLVDRRLTLAVDNRGQLERVTFADDPDNKRSAAEKDEMTQRLLSMLVPVPEVAVGVGAKWRVVTVLRQAPAIVKQTATYTLSELGPTEWKIAVDIRRTANGQRLTAPDAPGPVVELTTLLRVLQGNMTVDPKHALGTGTLTVTSTLHVRARTLNGELEEITEDSGSVEMTVAP